MKRNMMTGAFLLASVALSVSAYAQNGFYAALSGGAGMGNMKTDATYQNQQSSNIDQSSTLTYNGALTLGYQYKNWRLQAGLQYLRSGYELKHLQFGTDFDPALSTGSFAGNYKINYGHIGIPLQVGYIISPARRLSLVPYLGILTSYNTGARSVIHAPGIETTTKWTKADFGNRYNQFSLWATASLYLEYRINGKVSLFGGPSAQYMMTQFGKSFSDQKNHNVGIDFGVKVRL